MQEVYFRDADGAVYCVRLASVDANSAVDRFPHEWARSPDGFAPRPAHLKGQKPVGPRGIAGNAGGDPSKPNALGVIAQVSGPTSHAAA